MDEILLKKLKRAKGNIALSVGAILLSLFFFVESNRIKDGAHSVVSSKLFPRIYAGVMLACALAILIDAIKAYNTVPKEIRDKDKLTKESKAGYGRVLAVFAVLLVTAIVYKPLGFLTVTPFTMLLIFIIIEKPEKRNYPLFLGLSILCPIVVYFAFYYLFSNLLPMGILKPFLIQFM